MPFVATWMDLEIIKRKTNIIWDDFYVESKKIIQINLFTKQLPRNKSKKRYAWFLWRKW